jgi:glycosyltransferase involved in cell wall biosynthesis
MAGYNIKVYGFDNGLYNENILNKSYPIYRFKTNRNKIFNILKRCFILMKIIFSIQKEDILYAFGIDVAFCCLLIAGCKKYIYEEADLNYTKFKNKYIVYLFKTINKYIIEHSLTTVLTSEGFVEYLYHKTNIPNQIIVLPNKLNIFFTTISRDVIKIQQIDKLRFGFIGLIRYPNTIVRFAEVIGKHFLQHEFHFWGDGFYLETAIKRCESYKNIFFHGSFRNPEDLCSIYAKIDINVVCYDTAFANTTIAEPNKLYESMFFGKAILVSSDTYLAKRVNDLGVGFSLDASNDTSIKQFILSLNLSEINDCIQRDMDMPVCKLLDTTNDLVKRINSF